MTTETAATSTLDDRSAVGGPDLPQERRLVTEIPGPKSRALQERRTAAVASGRRQRAPGVRRGRRRRRDRGRRRQLADRPRQWHRRGERRQQRARGGATASPTRWPPSRTPASWSRRTRATWRSARQLARLTPGDHAKKAALFNSGAEAVENAVKIARAHTGRDAVVGVRPRLPRAHQPDDGDDVEEHALQARLRPVRRRGLPGADVLPVPRGERAHRRSRRPPARST